MFARLRLDPVGWVAVRSGVWVTLGVQRMGARLVEDVLLRFLHRGLLDVRGDDSKLERLQQAASDLAATLRKTPSKTIPFSLVSFDPQIPDDDPIVSEVVDVLRKRWATYANVFSGTPTTLIRAMLLEALAQAAAADGRIGAAFVALARNILPHMEAAGEQAIWADVVPEIERRVDTRAEEEWATPSSIMVSAPQIELSESNPLTLTVEPVDRDHLRKLYRAAAGPQFHNPQQGTTIATNGNPHWPQNNAPWVTEFGQRLAEATADTVEAVVSEAMVDQADLTGALKSLVVGISAYVDETLRAVSTATAGLQRRTHLLWWKEALFSPSARLSYRDLPQDVAAPLMAFDLHQQIPTFSPASVAAFLSEAVLCLPSVDPSETHSIRELVATAREHAGLAVLRAAGTELVAVPAGRCSVLALISHPEVRASHTEEEFRRLTGLSPETELTLPSWAIWVFRELQAVKAVTNYTTAKRRGRKG
ncbi:GTPase-associated system all-helical protein GASH [Sphaerimonospora cavernae]|uniref:GTPase-associated system all-helical protein GASH n=1 Tax=Sphaerimonospora cavernae TaxID=1740611 RepID=A0ABV6U1A2_9ACTN